MTAVLWFRLHTDLPIGAYLPGSVLRLSWVCSVLDAELLLTSDAYTQVDRHRTQWRVAVKLVFYRCGRHKAKIAVLLFLST